jgi:glycosyltransferase involved in cell wall biosynthesis
VEGFSLGGCQVIVSSSPGSAAYNRNCGLEMAGTELVIMIDDDIRGFYDGWWQDMVRPLIKSESDVIMVSARLIKQDGTLGEMNGSRYLVDQEWEDVAAFPSACIAFRKADLGDIVFNEAFKGSGFEDTLFCDQMRKKHMGKRLVINNRCRMIHVNEMKNQKCNFEHNERTYRELSKK